MRHVAETRDPASFAHNPAWTANYEATKDLPAATGEDIVWADAVIFGSPTRFGSVASQLRDFLDSLGGLWAARQARGQGVRGASHPRNTLHGGQETTLLTLYVTLMHFGGIIVPPGYTDPLKFVDGNPYGVSLVCHPRQHQRFRPESDRATGAALDHLARRVVSVADRLASTPEPRVSRDDAARCANGISFGQPTVRRSR